MRHKLIQAVVVLSLILIVGGHWLVLQSIAWVGMFANYSQTCSVTEAIVKTFDGRNPCQLCLVVKQGKESEKRQPSLKVETKLDSFLLEKAAVWQLPEFANSNPRAHPGLRRVERLESPPTPPPRHA